MGRKKEVALPVLTPQQIRQQVKHSIQTRMSVGQRWKCLEEAVHSEDVRREQHFKRILFEDSRVLPMVILKFIKTLKRAVASIISTAGGTPYSIIRELFLNWDSAKTGSLSPSDLDRCMKSLGVSLTLENRNAIVNYYKGENLMPSHLNYNTLLHDIQIGEPGLIHDASSKNVFEERFGDDEMRFKTVDDSFAVMPALVVSFIEALQSAIALKVRKEGGTPYSQLRTAFMRYDSTYSSALSAKDFMKSMNQSMKLAVSMEQAHAIVKFYDRNFRNEFDYKLLLKDVCSGMPSLIHHREVSQEENACARQALVDNPFIRKPFSAVPNRSLEIIKEKIRSSLAIKVKAQGGSMYSWLHDAFTAWDPKVLGHIDNENDLRGAIKKCGVQLTDEEVAALRHLYDMNQDGCMHFSYFVQDILQSESDLITISKPRPSTVAGGATSSNTHSADNVSYEVLPKISKMLKVIGRAVEVFNLKAKGHLNSRDVLMGTFMRFDTNGRVTPAQTKNVFRVLKIHLTEEDIVALTSWYDTNGSQKLDYREVIKDLYGSDDVLLTKCSVTAMPVHHAPPEPISDYSAWNRNKKALKKANSMDSLADVPGSMVALPFSPVKETNHMRETRLAAEKKVMTAEKIKVEMRLASIERQRKSLLDAYKSSHNSNT